MAAELTELLVYEATSNEEQRSAQEILEHTGVDSDLKEIFPSLNEMVFNQYDEQLAIGPIDTPKLKYLLNDAGVQRRKMLKLKAAEE